MEKLEKSLVDSFKPLYPNPINSLFLFGEKANFQSVGMVLETASAEEIVLIKKNGSLKCCKTFSFPYIFSKEFIHTSLDSFPLEFLELKTFHKTIIGESPFLDLEISKIDLRLQCERELKGKSLHLKAALLNCKDEKSLRDILLLSRQDFNRIALGLIYLLSGYIPKTYGEIGSKVAEIYTVENGFLSAIFSGDIEKKQTENITVKYITMLDKLSKTIE